MLPGERIVSKRRKAPKNTFWRAAVLWGRIKVKGRDIKWSLRTNDPNVAAVRVQAERERQIAAAYYGDDRKSCQDVMQAWAEHHIPHHVSPNTVKRYLVSLGQLQPPLEGRYIDEIDKAVVTAIVDRRRAAGASTATIRRDLTALSSVLGYAADREWRSDDNPALARLRKLKERRACPHLFWHHDGEPYRNVASRFAAIMKAAARQALKDRRDFRPFRFHDLRHLHAVEWLKSGRSIYDLQQRLGHESIKTTELYLKFLTPAEVRIVKYVGPQKGEYVQRFREAAPERKSLIELESEFDV
jgi:site-specific recombinase XerD